MAQVDYAPRLRGPLCHDESCRRRWETRKRGGSTQRALDASDSSRGSISPIETLQVDDQDRAGDRQSALDAASTGISDFITTVDAVDQVPTEAALRRLNDSLERQAKRIAQALHDEAGQLLAAAHMVLAEAAHDLPASVRQRLRDVDSHLDGIEEQLRRLAHELRPRILDDLGLAAALEFLADGFAKRRAIRVTVDAAVDRLPPVIATTIYRIVQEALTNVAKHSHATEVRIGLSQPRGILLCTINDDGVGFDPFAIASGPDERGFGLAGARDQITALGGTMEINSAPGTGTALVIAIPVE
jgi:signal transduction histidine kinase